MRRSEFRRADAVVGLGGGLNAVCAATKVNGVDVVAQDLAFVLLTVDLERQQGFVDLAHEVGGGLAYVVALHVLLRDAGSALLLTQHDGAKQCPDRAPHVYAWIVVERAVLGGYERVGHVVGEGVDVHDGAVCLAQSAYGRDPVRKVDGGGLKECEVRGLGGLERRIPDQQTHYANHRYR